MKQIPGIRFKEGFAEVVVWSPEAEKVELILQDESRTLLQQADEGYWTLKTDNLKPGDRYQFSINGEDALPDPASLSQPEGVHAASQAVDLSYEWTDADWKNPVLDDYIIYELHIGTFTPEGTFHSAIEKLPHLKQLGINAIEIMPIAQFPGGRNWGYDGVFPFAAQNTYGGYQGLMELVNACHAQGIAVVLDVVYNHLGPEGNYFGAYGPYFTGKYKTPWGDALNFDDAWSDGVRNYFIQNVLMWLRDFHIDALRLDAVHAIKDFSPLHVLREMKQRVEKMAAETGRQHYLIVEMDLNDTRFIEPLAQKGYGMDAQWIDEFHHALRVAAGGERDGYYEDFDGIAHLAKTYRDAYVYDGQWSPHRSKYFGTKAEGHPGRQFIAFSQNHDQVGNRMLGDRSSQLFSFEMQKLMAGAVLAAPYLPMLFMGEEWSAQSPFQYFVSHTEPELVEAVRKGRKAEFAAFHAEGEAPDPQSEETFNNSKLNWDELAEARGSKMLDYYKTFIALRKQLPALHILDRNNLSVDCDEQHQLLWLRRWQGDAEVFVAMNFSDKPQQIALPSGCTWHVALTSAHMQFGGPGELEIAGYIANIQPQSLVLFTN